MGWQSLDITFDDDVSTIQASEFTLTSEGGLGEGLDEGGPLQVVAVTPLDFSTPQVLLSDPITPGAWTTITHLPSGTSTVLGFLPADVNGDGTSEWLDVVALLDVLYSVGDPPPIWATDVNRSGAVDAGDLLRVIDLLNGAGEYREWNGASLP